MMELEKLRDWIGRRKTDIDYVTVPRVHRLSATLDLEDRMPKAGDPLPIGWQQISSRSVRPLFVNRPFQICGEPAPGNRTAKLWVVYQDGASTLLADAEF